MANSSARDHAAQLDELCERLLELLTVFRRQREGVTTQDADEFDALLKQGRRRALLGGFPEPPSVVDGLVIHNWLVYPPQSHPNRDAGQKWEVEVRAIQAAARAACEEQEEEGQEHGSPPDESPHPPRRKMTVEEANEKAMKLAGRMKQAFFLLSEREQARLIGCHWRTWTKTTFYAKAQQKRGRIARKVAGQKVAGTRPAVSLTGAVEAVVGDGERNEVLNCLIDGERKPTDKKPEWEDLSPAEQQELVADQEADYEPDPLDDDRRKKVRTRKRL
jgi:hypothetical protein